MSRSTLLKNLLRPATLAILLFLCFFGFYWKTGQVLRDTPMYAQDDIFFRADTTRAFRDLTGDRLASHSHTSGHPNFVIFHNAIGGWFTNHYKTTTKGISKMESRKSASIVLTAAGGAGTVAFLFLLLHTFGLPLLRSILFAGVLGFSSVNVFYASAPETYIFSALGITSVAFLAVRRKSHEAWWQLAAVYAWSALATSIALVVIWALTRYRESSLKMLVWKLTKVMALTTVIMVGLAYLQSAIYPRTNLFFVPDSVAKETGWFTLDNLAHPVDNSRILLQHQWLSNIVAPEPQASAFAGHPMASIEKGYWPSFAPVWPLFALWSILLVIAASALRHRSFYQPAVLAALGTLAFNFLFFFVFGHDRMLYAGLWTSCSVFAVAAGVEFTLQRQSRLQKPLTALLVLFVGCQAWHNWHFLGKLVAIVGG